MSYGQWKIDEEKTKKEYGYSSSELSTNSHQPVCVFCVDCGAISFKEKRFSNRKHRCPSIINSQKKCYKCNQRKNLEDFSKNRHTFDGYQKVCKECFASYDCVKECYKRKSYKLKNDFQSFIEARVANIRSRCKRKSLECDIDAGYLKNILEEQQYKCYYTGVKLVKNKGRPKYNSISFDRVDPNKGYIKTNIVACCYAANSFKGSLELQQFKDFLREALQGFEKFIKEE